MKKLNNINVLVTRPPPKAQELCRLIEENGGLAVYFPTIAFAPPPSESALQAALKQLPQQDWLVFISPQAVYACFNQLKNTWLKLTQTVKLAAIGAGTAETLYELGCKNVVYPEQEYNSQGFLTLPEFQNIEQKKIAIIRGLGGREQVDQVLLERGATILTVIVYQRIMPDCNIDQIVSLLKQKALDVIVCTSYQGVHNLKILLKDEAWPYLYKIPLIVMSERIKMLAQDLGFQRIWVTNNASQTAILDLLAEKGCNHD